MGNGEIAMSPPIKYEQMPGGADDQGSFERKEKLELQSQTDPTATGDAVLDAGQGSSEFAVNPVAAQVGTTAVQDTVTVQAVPGQDTTMPQAPAHDNLPLAA